MTTTMLEAPSTLFPTPTRETPCRETPSRETPAREREADARPREAGGARQTLEELLAATWRNAHTNAQADCPMCRATMRLEQGQARCDGCGTTLS